MMQEWEWMWRAAPVEMTQISLIIGSALLAVVVGLLYSERSRKLALFALFVVGVLVLLFGVVVYTRLNWLPRPIL